jgi:prolyl oligopeptidase
MADPCVALTGAMGTAGAGYRTVATSKVDTSENDDPFVWLEEMDSPQAAAWVLARNIETTRALCDERFEQDRKTLLDILNAPDRIPFVIKHADLVYNFWQDGGHPKGLWRRTTLASYRMPNPDWEVILDIDALAAADGEDWVWRGCVSLPPMHRHGLVQLSRGGADAVVIREFDLVDKRFVDDGFVMPEAKSNVAWLDQNTVLVSSALGGEPFQTTSGYARTVRRWQRGTSFEAAPVVFECERTEMHALGWRVHSPNHPRTCFLRRPDFFHCVLYAEDRDGIRRQVDIPSDASFGIERNWLIVSLRTEWVIGDRSYPAGMLLAIDIEARLAGSRDFAVLFEPTATSFLQRFDIAGNVAAFTVLDDVRSRAFLARHQNGTWQVEQVSEFPDMSTIELYRLVQDDVDWAGEERCEAETFVVASQNTILPPTLWFTRFGAGAEPIKQAPARFNAAGIVITQHHATSVDGVTIPYFQIARADIQLDRSNFCLLTGYGGYQISTLPYYAAHVGKLWLEPGGVLALANIRGGGEFGPDWHRAGMRAGKKLAHDDFAAVAEDLIARGVTQPRRLACKGGSNGGLLVGNMLTRYPDLFAAIDCAVPLLDMKRYTKLSAGASWIAEYGDPENPEDWAFLQELSAYHHVESSCHYPPILLTTSARDDRVHPGHARKMAAKLAAQGHAVYFHEPREGGHAGAADNAHLAFNIALSFAFLRKMLEDGPHV